MKRHVKALLLVCSMSFVFVLPAKAAPADDKVVIPEVLSPAANANRRTAISGDEIKFRNTMRNLFTECLNRQRNLAVKILTNAEDLKQDQARLTETVNKIGVVFKTYYGDSTGERITTLFGQYIGATADYANSVRTDGDKAGVISRMHLKAEEIARLFNSFNPHWTKSGLSDALNNYCAMSIKEIDMEHTSIGKPDAQVFNATFKKSAEMAEILSTGIARQFRDKFKRDKK